MFVPSYARVCDSLTERVVRTINFCFKKIAVDKGLGYDWDELLWSVVLSYNAAKQESTGVAPFTLLFAQEATVPPDLKVAPSLDFSQQIEDEKDARVRDLLQRAESVRRMMIHAGCSLEVAQHRDTLRYESRRGGEYMPRPHQFKAGDFVYIRQKPRSGMEVATKPAILKLVKIKRDGVVVLEDAAKIKEKSTVQNIALCHLQVKDQYDCAAARPSKHHLCEVCRRPDGEASMLLCDTCNKGEWLCPLCKGETLQAAVAQVGMRLSDKIDSKEQQLKESLAEGSWLLPFDVGPNRTVGSEKGQPWQAQSMRSISEKQDMCGNLPDRIDWGDQETLTEMVNLMMPGSWNEGHRTVLSKKYREQKIKVRALRFGPAVPALADAEVKMKKRDVKSMTKKQVRNASALQWGLELIITVPTEVRRLATEVSWDSIHNVWGPWAGTGVIGEVMRDQWPHLKVMNNDWNSQLGWPEARDACSLATTVSGRRSVVSVMPL
ncbi:hypothetical protein CYMTET_12752 [Cymbomonas tetramitiformis]|uniref:Uncharacterized protein n=1 Tax=Cymbomonas tetramitiformis TaxID=36881 RepID=A0AAE0GJF2_9CHLO|nr:hypothetical protein CYMTET_12752 [Cymbomonas tetramitiformis]